MHACGACRNEFSAYLLLEKTNGSGSAAAGPGAAAALGGVEAMTYSASEPPPLPPGAAHKELISGLVHVDTGNGPDKWYTAGKDGTVRIWNGKVNKIWKINVLLSTDRLLQPVPPMHIPHAKRNSWLTVSRESPLST